jgi:cytochrome c5
MPYTIDDITELIRYHLVLSEESVEKADANLAQLMRDIEEMVAAPRGEPVYWRACEACFAWVSSELIGLDGAGEAADGGFYCTSCRFMEES